MSKGTVFVRSHLGAAIAAVAAAVIIVGGILLLVTAGGGSSAASAPTTTSSTVAPHKAGRGGANGERRQGVRGSITAMNGDTWTVLSAKGATVTVQITPSTTFGTKAHPVAASDFSLGDRIVVIGARSGSTVTATRIAIAGAGAASTTTVPAATS